MGIGYIIGCLLSIMLWKIDKQSLFIRLSKLEERYIRNKIIIEFGYILFFICLFVLILKIKPNEFFNAVTAFMVVDVSNTERKNLSYKNKIHFYDSISTISRSLICGFIAPIFYIITIGNSAAILYMLVYNTYMVHEDMKLIKACFNILSILPSLLAQLFLYLIFTCKNKTLKISYEGDYLVNCIARPLLNIDILAAYIESVNFYYYYRVKKCGYVKCYGKFTRKIDSQCIKDYLSITYIVCLIYFTFFMVCELAIKSQQYRLFIDHWF